MFIVQNSYWLYPKTVIQSYIITSKKYVIQKSYEAVPTGSAVRKEENEKKGKIRFKEEKKQKKMYQENENSHAEIRTYTFKWCFEAKC